MTEPGLGSGALREALKAGDEVWVRAKVTQFVEPTHNGVEIRLEIGHGTLMRTWCNSADLLSLSSPIEPPTEIANLIAFHEKETDVWAEQLVKARERIAELESGAQASSEIREALAEMTELKRRMDSESGPKLWSYGTIYAYVVNRIEELLAPSRQGAAKRVEG